MKNDYWKIYYSADVIEKSEKRRKELKLASTGVNIHLDVYQHANVDAPVLIFNHGAAGYCRLFVLLALAFCERGYTVLLPDQKGQGLSEGRRGDYTVAECVQNIVDVAEWAKEHLGASVFMAGGSVGGALTYYAAASAPVQAIACLNLFDFGNGADGISISRLAPLAKYPAVVDIFKMGMKLLKPLYGLRIPFRWLGAFEKLMDERDETFQNRWDADPIPPRLVSLRSLASNMHTPPAVPFEKNEIPTLVLNQSFDKMVDVVVTRRNYARLGGEKRYLEVPYGHWSSQDAFWEALVEACDNWFKAHI